MSSSKARGRNWCYYIFAAKATGYRNFTAVFQFDNTDGTASDMANIALNGIPSITFAAVRSCICKHAPCAHQLHFAAVIRQRYALLENKDTTHEDCPPSVPPVSSMWPHLCWRSSAHAATDTLACAVHTVHRRSRESRGPHTARIFGARRRRHR